MHPKVIPVGEASTIPALQRKFGRKQVFVIDGIRDNPYNPNIRNWTTMSPAELTRRLKSEAERVGFDSVGVCAADEAAEWPRFKEWLSREHDGNMPWLSDRVEAYRHPKSVLPGVRSLVMLTKNYRTVPPQPIKSGQGRISRYAWGTADYHDMIHDQLKQLCGWMVEQVPGSHSRGVVDTAPLLERQFAEVAGLGWRGKNTLLLQPDSGSLFFSGCVSDRC